MNRTYRLAIAAAAAALAAAGTGIVVGPDRYPLLLLVAAAGGPLAVAAAVAARLRLRLPAVALAAGPAAGIALALAAHALVAGFVYVFVAGFAAAAADLADTLAADPRLADVLGSPWLVVALVGAVAVAPLLEEAGKAAGGIAARPAGRREAFLAGVAAGAGFAVVENVAYAALGAWFGGAWPEIALARGLGAAVHPLASGLVVMGWWESRNGRRGALARWYLAGVGVHALWNGSIVVMQVVEGAFDLGGVGDPLTTAGFGYLMALAAAMGAMLWWATRSVAGDRAPLGAVPASGRVLAAWTLAAATLLVPVTILLAAFPGFYP